MSRPTTGRDPDAYRPPAPAPSVRRRRRSRRLRRPRLLGAPPVPRRPLDPGPGRRRRLLRPVVPPRRPEPPALGPGVAARHPPDRLARRGRAGGRPQPHPGRLVGGGRRPTGRSAGRRAGDRRWPSPSAGPDPSRPRPTTVGGTPTTTTTLPPLDYHPTPAAPLKVLIVGDSVGLDLGSAAGQHARRLRRRHHLPRRPHRHRADPARLLQLAGRAADRPHQPAAQSGGGDDRGQRPPGARDPGREPAVRAARVGRGLLRPGGRLHRRGQRRRGPRAVGRDAAHAGPGPGRRAQAPQRPGRRPR